MQEGVRSIPGLSRQKSDMLRPPSQSQRVEQREINLMNSSNTNHQRTTTPLLRPKKEPVIVKNKSSYITEKGILARKNSFGVKVNIEIAHKQKTSTAAPLRANLNSIVQTHDRQLHNTSRGKNRDEYIARKRTDSSEINRSFEGGHNDSNPHTTNITHSNMHNNSHTVYSKELDARQRSKSQGTNKFRISSKGKADNTSEMARIYGY
eukprot:TRINITY_DN5867_c0_g1_i6.p1 TRINITY_DN5867_c0_g1~~TRINITY_DN5867_c0_g1_i6.p1  ORF type:complete len:207 (+),score=33.17 TRINITY_DN5867_c0_g1_i6:76-696(+)